MLCCSVVPCQVILLRCFGVRVLSSAAWWRVAEGNTAVSGAHADEPYLWGIDAGGKIGRVKTRDLFMKKRDLYVK